ncbi:MAG: NAD(P)(+) transhydrogenase (Re/Si-specific) subunit beta [Planctomycetota bacterium]|jgi:NAD(P) transhydrogenase subunit beta
MDRAEIINIAYIIASILFILGLKKLSSPKTARRGNAISSLGMLTAVVAVLCDQNIISYQWILIGMIAGSLVGAIAAKRVAMTGMPEMVALFNGFGGISSLLLAWSEFHTAFRMQDSLVEQASAALQGQSWSGDTGTLIAIVLAALIGGITFTGSVIAWGKLSTAIPGKPIMFLGQKVINAVLLAAALVIGVLFCLTSGDLVEPKYTFFIAVVAISLILGVLAVISIGGGDMPVVISLLNSYSGLAACAAGFVIVNNVLIVSGALVGASGLILTNIMCKAMNRSLSNVLFSGFGSATTAKKREGVQGEVKPINCEDAYLILEAASSVVITPGYGMAVAQAQHVVRELGELMEKNGTEVRYAIHPVAGRMPGHMNVLLAEANVSYDLLVEPDDVNPTMETVDVCIVIGANDVVNPDARDDESSPIYGMPVIEVDRAKTVFVLKRSMNAGFAGIDNPLFFGENTRMLFGDAKASVGQLVAEFKEE